MAMSPRDDYDRDILDIIPERFDADADSKQARAGHRLRSYLTLGVAVVAVGAIVATGLHFMGGKQAGGPGIPVIKADERPIKIRPDDRGGMQVPNQDKLVYERMEQGEGDAKVERLLPPPEQPQVPVKGAATAEQAAKPAGTEVLRPGQPAAPQRPAVEAKAPEAKAPLAAEPVAQAPVPLQPAPAAPAPQAQPQPAAPAGGYVPTQARGQAAPATAPAAPVAAVPPPKVTAAPVPAPAAAPVPAAAPPVAAPKAPPSGDWLIQLGALRTAPDADKEWGRIQRANHDLLGALKPDVVRVELGEKGTFWRLRAGPLSEQAAKQLCNELKARNQGCIIARK
ncbi:MAG: SPOR domain-containing protein [Magnetospirillum sp.]|nr:SPOR domain-containing protein [Magnetospirillum sp.]